MFQKIQIFRTYHMLQIFQIFQMLQFRKYTLKIFFIFSWVKRNKITLLFIEIKKTVNNIVIYNEKVIEIRYIISKNFIIITSWNC